MIRFRLDYQQTAEDEYRWSEHVLPRIVKVPDGYVFSVDGISLVILLFFGLFVGSILA